MAIGKNKLGETKKYSSVISNIQNKKPQIEPKITPLEVVQTFGSFGFKANDKKQNNIAFWTSKPKSELQKLVEELHKRREEINKTQEALKKKDDLKKQTVNDIHEKTKNDILKKHSENAVNVIPTVPKDINTSIGTPSNGTGGPKASIQSKPTNQQEEMSQSDAPVTPFFVGDHALIKILSPNHPNGGTLWLADTKKKVLHPITSEKHLDTAFKDPQEAKNSIINVSSQALASGGPLADFTPLGQEHALKHDGSFKKVDFSPYHLKNHYGKPKDPNMENKALLTLDQIIGKLKERKQ